MLEMIAKGLFMTVTVGGMAVAVLFSLAVIVASIYHGLFGHTPGPETKNESPREAYSPLADHTGLKGFRFMDDGSEYSVDESLMIAELSADRADNGYFNEPWLNSTDHDFAVLYRAPNGNYFMVTMTREIKKRNYASQDNNATITIHPKTEALVFVSDTSAMHYLKTIDPSIMVKRGMQYYSDQARGRAKKSKKLAA